MEDEQNVLSNFEDFANEPDEDLEEEELIEEEVEEQEEEEKPKKQLSKQEYAIVKTKQENKTLKDYIRALEDRLVNLEKVESGRSTDSKRKTLIQGYIDKGYDEDIAGEMADNKLERELMKEELENIKSKFQSTYDVKTQAEQAVLYKQSKAQKSNVGVSDVKTSGQNIKLTKQQQRVWDLAQKAPWGKDMKLEEFIKQWEG